MDVNQEFIQCLRGRAEFCRDRGEVKTPELLDRAAKLLEAKASVPEGFVLVEKSKIKTYWQDGDESENTVYSLNDLDDLGECIGDDEVIEVNELSYAYTSDIKKYGVWKVQMIDEHGNVHKSFVLTSSHDDAEKIIQANNAVHAQHQAKG